MDLPNTKQRAYLKTRFAYGEIPTQQDFADLIEAGTNQLDDGLAKAGSGPLCIQAGSDPNQPDQPVLSLFSNFKDPSPLCVLRLNPSADPKDATSARPGLGIGDARGMTRLFLDAQTGNVGIGTVAPKAALHVVGVGLVIGNVGIGTVEPKAALHVEGVGLVSDGGGWAVQQMHGMAKGSLTIGSIKHSFGGQTKWVIPDDKSPEGMAGLMLETLDNTEIAIHRYGKSGRIVSAMYYNGNDNTLTIGRELNADWGRIATVTIAGDLRVEGKINAKAEADDWHDVEYQSGWSTCPDFYAACYFKDPFGIVHLRGMVIGDTVARGDTIFDVMNSLNQAEPVGCIFQLPNAYRPDVPAVFSVWSLTATRTGVLSVGVRTDGYVVAVDFPGLAGIAAPISLDGIAFRAALPGKS